MPATKPKVINGISFDISQPYVEGHTLTALEANVLNQVRAENIGNNVRQRVKNMVDGTPAEGDKAAVPASSPEEIQAYVRSIDAEYVFRTASEGSRTSRDPYETEARKIARDLVKNHLAQTGRKINVAPDGHTADSWKDKVDDQVDKLASSDKVLAAAKRAVDAKKKQTEALMAAFDDVEV